MIPWCHLQRDGITAFGVVNREGQGRLAVVCSISLLAWNGLNRELEGQRSITSQCELFGLIHSYSCLAHLVAQWSSAIVIKPLVSL
jgi:hypothetical protein